MEFWTAAARNGTFPQSVSFTHPDERLHAPRPNAGEYNGIHQPHRPTQDFPGGRDSGERNGISFSGRKYISAPRINAFVHSLREKLSGRSTQSGFENHWMTHDYSPDDILKQVFFLFRNPKLCLEGQRDFINMRKWSSCS
ncbi:hypothetical protein NPIL_116611 [Nephila pilipes]|uniref:Uncharacterized protein n=1 Tax=Nephila pilipes TaxID=299642 RepID=A0A8X6U5Y9_NEPPI|nr:hypothetical protein NPIL_116611 [Nephila pilipes]